ncbi:MAG: glycosyltransferase family 4 protein [Thiomonas delicata]
MIKVGIDVSRVRGGMTGVGRYAAGVLSALDAAMPEARFVLYAYRDTSFVPSSSRWHIVQDKHPFWSRMPVTQWMHSRLGALIAQDPVDVFWSPNTFVPAGACVPCVLTVYDFNHVIVPETLPPVTRYAYRKWMNGDILAADANVSISHGTAQRMFELLGRRPDAIAYPAVTVQSTISDDGKMAQLIDRVGVRKPYLLTVGTRAPRKNLAGAVAAMEQLRAAGLFLNHQLVMAGPEAWDRGGRDVERGRDWIRTLGFVDDELLAVLYANAEALVFPSLYEGFGMPVIEARAHGCRVVTTDSPELREAGGDDAIYTDTTSEGIAVGIRTALSRPRPLPRQIEHRWQDAAEQMASVFRKLAAPRPRR